MELIKSREEVRMRPRQAPRFSRVAGKVAQKTLSGLKYLRVDWRANLATCITSENAPEAALRPRFSIIAAETPL